MFTRTLIAVPVLSHTQLFLTLLSFPVQDLGDGTALISKYYYRVAGGIWFVQLEEETEGQPHHDLEPPHERE